MERDHTRSLSFVIVDGNQAKIEPYPFIFVNGDGSARELHSGERNYLETPFHPADGGRPYTKDGFSQKNGWGEIAGFMMRSLLPEGIHVRPAPLDDPSKPLTNEEQIQFLRDKGMEVIENGDGTFTARKPRR
jgi:hypothetical protein